MDTASNLYEQLFTEREHYVNRARRASLLTLPPVMPQSGSNYSEDFVDPFQSIGARGVNNLASKLHLTLLPPTGPFFRFNIPQRMKAELEDTTSGAEIQATLSEIEGDIMRQLDHRGIRSRGATIFRHLLISGNALLHIPDKGDAKVHRLDQYVVENDGEGNLMNLVLKEMINPSFLPEEIRDNMAPEDGEVFDGGPTGDRKSVSLYTAAMRQEDGGFTVYQEVHGQRFNETTDVKEERLPFIVLRWTEMDGENYGRGFVDDYLGDLVSLEGLRQAIVQASAAASKVVWLVSPNGTTNSRNLARAKNGAFVAGREEDLGRLALDKGSDMSVAANQIEAIRDDLRHAFLLNSAIQRNGERVTAEEIRYMAQELEDTLGGAYSILASSFQRKLVERLRDLVDISGSAKKVLRQLDLTIITGLEALGRGHELNRLDVFLQGAQQMLGPEVVGQYINPSEYMARRAAALNIDSKGLVRSQEEVQQEQQQQQMASMAETVAPEAMRQMGAAAQQEQG